MKTLNSIIATITVITVMIMAMFTSFVASANVYEDRLNEAFKEIINDAMFPFSNKDASQFHNIYSNPETGVKEGQLDVYKFTIDNEGMDLINAVQKVYEQIGEDHRNDLISTKELYTLWWNDNNGDFQGFRLYYNPEDAIVVGLACDHCYTVGFVASDNKQYRKTYTLEWSNSNDNDSINGRIITTYAPIKPKTTDGHRLSSVIISSDDYDKYMEQFQAGMEKYQQGMEKYQAEMEKTQGALSDLSDGQSLSFSFSSSSSSSSSSQNNSKWIKELLFYVGKIQQSGNRYLYLSKLYDLCKDTDCLDQTDLKIAMRQLAAVYQQLKEKKNLKENELLFLESMVDLLDSKIKK